MNPVYLIGYVLILAIFPNGIRSQNTELIQTTCQGTPYKDYCISMLKGTKAMNLTDIVEIVIKTSRLHARRAEDKILLFSAKSAKEKKAWKRCLLNYKDAVQLMYDSVTAVEDKRYKDVIKKAYAGITAAGACSSTFKGKVSPIADVSEEFVKTCTISISIAQKFNGKS